MKVFLNVGLKLVDLLKMPLNTCYQGTKILQYYCRFSKNDLMG